MEKILNVEGHSVQVSTGYEKGGYNMLSGESNERGYYVYAMPCSTSKDGCAIETELFNGVKCLLFEAGRQSKKQAAKAVSMVTDDLINKTLIPLVEMHCHFID